MSIVLKERIELPQLLYYFWEKNTEIENMFKTNKKSTKNYVILVLAQSY